MFWRSLVHSIYLGWYTTHYACWSLNMADISLRTARTLNWSCTGRLLTNNLFPGEHLIQSSNCSPLIHRRGYCSHSQTWGGGLRWGGGWVEALAVGPWYVHCRHRKCWAGLGMRWTVHCILTRWGKKEDSFPNSLRKDGGWSGNETRCQVAPRSATPSPDINMWRVS